MYKAGRLLYFDPFYFKDGGSSKPKYFLVLKVTGNNVILASLPSSQSHLPQKQVIQHGCLEIPETCITCYIFEAGRPVTQAGWAFELHTFLHGHWLNDYTLEMMQLNYVIEGVDYEIIGDLTEAELSNIINCFKNSATVKRKYKRWLNE